MRRRLVRLTNVGHMPRIEDVDDYDMGCAATAGNRPVNVEPFPKTLETVRSPPIRRQKWRLMARPRPVPPYFDRVLASAWENASNRRPSCSSVMPMPVSETEKERKPHPPAPSPLRWRGGAAWIIAPSPSQWGGGWGGGAPINVTRPGTAAASAGSSHAPARGR